MKHIRLEKLSRTAAALGMAIFLHSACGFAAEDAHKDHDHAAESKEKKSVHGHEGARNDLGTTTVSSLKISAFQIGKVEAGKEGIFEIELGAGTKEPKAVRLWVGVASGEGSTKAKANKEGDEFEAHVEVPKTLPTGSSLWVEIQPGSGAKAKASFALKQ